MTFIRISANSSPGAWKISDCLCSVWSAFRRRFALLATQLVSTLLDFLIRTEICSLIDWLIYLFSRMLTWPSPRVLPREPDEHLHRCAVPKFCRIVRTEMHQNRRQRIDGRRRRLLLQSPARYLLLGNELGAAVRYPGYEPVQQNRLWCTGQWHGIWQAANHAIIIFRPIIRVLRDSNSFLSIRLNRFMKPAEIVAIQ